MKNIASVSVPVGVSSLDENAIRCKARTVASSYIKSKPVNFSIRYYLLVRCDVPYAHSMWEYNLGN